jgi:putative permease
MTKVLIDWWHRYFSEPEAGILFSILVLMIVFFGLFHKMLAPVLTSIVFAYLLDWGVAALQRLKCPHMVAVLVVFIVALTLVILLFVGVSPLLSKQATNLIAEMPRIVVRLQSVLTNVPQHFSFISEAQVQNFLSTIQSRLGHFGQSFLSYSFTLIPNIVSLVVYLVMVPMLVYFFMMDKSSILRWISQRFIPKRRKVLTKVWSEVHTQIGNYVRGKVVEAIIVTVVSYLTFWVFGLQYALLLGALVGVSVIIPYVGAIVVTIPIMVVAALQWGWSSHFIWLMVAYAIISALDGNVLVPILFSEAVSLHPVAIIVAVLVFGGMWGFWGIFFAIPLAALVKALLDNWPVATR